MKGVIGNSLVLISDSLTQVQRVSLDRGTVILIENIAAADLVIVIIVFGVISWLTSSVAGMIWDLCCSVMENNSFSTIPSLTYTD